MRDYQIEDINKIVELLVGPLLVFTIAAIFIGLALLIVLLIGRIKLFNKAGYAGWKAIIPIYGNYIQDVKISGLHWAFFVAEEIVFFGWVSSIVTIVVKAMSFYNLANKCHEDPIPVSIFGGIFAGIVTTIYGLSNRISYDSSVKVGSCSFFNNLIK